MARVVRTEIRKRGFFGVVIKWLFILFNLLMIFWIGSYFLTVGETLSSATDDAARAGTAIGGTIGVGIILGFWVCGDIILGLLVLLTRGKKIISEEVPG